MTTKLGHKLPLKRLEQLLKQQRRRDEDAIHNCNRLLQIFEKAKSKKEAKGQDIAELQKDIDELHIKVADLKQNFDRASSSREQLVAKRMEYEMVKAELTECRKIKKLIS